MLGAVTCFALMSASSSPELAVLPVVRGDVRPPAAATRAVLAGLARRGAQILPQDQLRALLERDRQPAQLDEAAMARLLDAAGRGEGDLQDSAQRLRQAVAGLETDLAPTRSRTRTLQRARLLLVRVLHDRLALLREPGLRRALQRDLEQQLDAAVRADPLVTMDLQLYSPALRRQLDLARQRVDRGPKGQLEIRSGQHDAQIFLEGRQIGAGPWFSDPALPAGRYRVWLQAGSCRSRTHTVEVGAEPVRVELRPELDCAVDPGEGVLRLADAAVLEDGLALALAERLEVEGLVLVGERVREDGAWSFALRFSAAAGARTHCVAVPAAQAAQTDWGLLLGPDAAGASGACPGELDGWVASQPGPSTGPAGVDKTAKTEHGDSPAALWWGAAGAAAVGLIGGGVALIGYLGWQDAYAQIDRGEGNGEELLRAARLGWNTAWIGAAVGLVGGVTALGLGGWALLGAKEPAELADPSGS